MYRKLFYHKLQLYLPSPISINVKYENIFVLRICLIYRLVLYTIHLMFFCFVFLINAMRTFILQAICPSVLGSEYSSTNI